jgi:hypothetical protein
MFVEVLGNPMGSPHELHSDAISVPKSEAGSIFFTINHFSYRIFWLAKIVSDRRSSPLRRDPVSK